MKIFDRNTLKDLRVLLRVDTRQLARVTGLSKQTIEKLESGEVTHPRDKTIARIAYAFSIPPSLLYYDEEHANINPSLAVVERKMKLLVRMIRVGVKDLDADLASLSLELSKLVFEVDNIRYDHIRSQALQSRRLSLQ